ncbi:MAG TPA: response regulator transcription factor [Polyangiaceae bacterium]
MLALALAAAVVADSALVRSGLAAILRDSPELEVVAALPASEADGLEAGTLDLVVRDVPADASGAAALAVLPRAVPVLAVVDGPEQARELVHAGARGVVVRGAPAEELRAASVAVASGLRALDDESFDRMFAPSANEADVGMLTPREREVLELVADGLSNKLIAEKLGVSEHTAKFHLRSILDKLGADTRTEAVAKAARRGMLVL